jgi:hypothetical protein
MSGPLSCESKSRNQSDYEPLEGGYCAADGTVKVASDEKKPAAPNMSVAPPPPQSAGVASLVRKSQSSSAVFVSRSKSDGTKLELGKASGQASGGQLGGRVSVVDAAIPISSTHEIKVSGLSGKATAGTQNADGSRGVNASIGASAASVEWSYSKGPESMSVNVGVGKELGFSSGVRDKDANGIPETCWSVELPSVSIAACSEDEAPPRTEGPSSGSEGTGSTSREERNEGSGGASGW